MQTVFVKLKGEKEWLLFGQGKVSETNEHLVLMDGAENVIGRIHLDDLIGWRQEQA